MIFRRAIVAELTSTASAVFTVLFSIIISVGLVRILGQAAGGRVDNQAVFELMALTSLTWLPIVLTLTLFIAVLMTLTRGWRDSEMVIWMGAGLPLTAWLKPVLIFAAPLVVVIAALSVFISPWAAQMGATYASRVDARDDVSRISPGVFGETSNRQRVFFVESVSGDQSAVQNVFVSSTHQGKQGVSMSRSGRTETAPNGDRFIVLENGRRYDGAPGDEQYRVTEFERFAARIETREGGEPSATPKNMSTLALLANPVPAAQGELVWRFGIPISALLLVLLAIPMSYVNPRAGRSANLLFALLTYVVYSNLLSVTQARVALGRLDFGVGWWLVHAGMALLLVAMFAGRMQLLRLRPRR